MSIYFSKPGVMCCAGTSIDELWNSVTIGNQKGIKKVKTATDCEFYAARIDDSKLEKSSARYDMRIMRIEEQALNQISDDIEKAKSKYGADRVAVCVGSCDNGTEFSVAGHRKFFANGKFDDDYNIEVQGADYVATFVSEKYGLTGPSSTFSTACSSSAGAIIKGAELIMAGIVDAAVVGGIDIASDTVLIGFNSLETISSEITNPLSKNRHGITLGEAGAFFVISKDDLSEGKNPEVVLLGWGESSDAYHMTSPDPSGAGAEKSMRRAIENAGLKPEQIDYVNLHGTGTKLNDSMESKAVNAVFGSYKVPVSTTKAITGHTLGAAAGLEAAICYKALVENIDKKGNNVKLPVQVWDKIQDPELPELNVVSETTGHFVEKEADGLKVCLSNSCAFGGANSTLVIALNK